MTADDRLVADALGAGGYVVASAVWDDPAVEWRLFDAVVIRSTWDYHLEPERFVAWLRQRDADGSTLLNPASVVLANLNKRYLCDLAAAGVAVVPTLYLPAREQRLLVEVLDGRGWDEVVIKPAVSASAYGTWRTSRSAAGETQAVFAADLARHDLLVQPFLREVVISGEWSLIFFAGEFSHAVRKLPATGDFRVQEELGGMFVPAEPPGQFITQAAGILSHIPAPLTYARVDGVELDGVFTLMELEVAEPFLYIAASTGAAGRFARAIVEGAAL